MEKSPSIGILNSLANRLVGLLTQPPGDATLSDILLLADMFHSSYLEVGGVRLVGAGEHLAYALVRSFGESRYPKFSAIVTKRARAKPSAMTNMLVSRIEMYRESLGANFS